MLETLVLLLFLGLIVSTLWWPRPVIRTVGAGFVGGLVYLACRGGLGAAGGLAPALVAAALAGWGLPQRVLKRVCFMVLSLVLLVFVTTWLMYSVPGSPFASEKQANEQKRHIP